MSEIVSYIVDVLGVVGVEERLKWIRMINALDTVYLLYQKRLHDAEKNRQPRPSSRTR